MRAKQRKRTKKKNFKGKTKIDSNKVKKKNVLPNRKIDDFVNIFGVFFICSSLNNEVNTSMYFRAILHFEYFVYILGNFRIETC